MVEDNAPRCGYFLKDSPSVGRLDNGFPLHYDASIELREGTEGYAITKVGFSRHGTVIHDSEGRMVLIDDSCGIPRKVARWDRDAKQRLNKSFGYSSGELDEICRAMQLYTETVSR